MVAEKCLNLSISHCICSRRMRNSWCLRKITFSTWKEKKKNLDWKKKQQKKIQHFEKLLVRSNTTNNWRQILILKYDCNSYAGCGFFQRFLLHCSFFHSLVKCLVLLELVKASYAKKYVRLQFICEQLPVNKSGILCRIFSSLARLLSLSMVHFEWMPLCVSTINQAKSDTKKKSVINNNVPYRSIVCK